MNVNVDNGQDAAERDLGDQDEDAVDGRVEAGGVEIDGDPHGFWVGPTLVDKVPLTSRVHTEEIFGPVLSVIRVHSYEDGLHGLHLINSGHFGNGTSIFTNDGRTARRFEREVEVGMVGVNVAIPVPIAYHPFGGWKASPFGDTKAYGVHCVDFFTREKAVTTRWLDPSHGGINLGFPSVSSPVNNVSSPMRISTGSPRRGTKLGAVAALPSSRGENCSFHVEEKWAS